MRLNQPFILVDNSIPLNIIENFRTLIEEDDWRQYPARKLLFPESGDLYDAIEMRHSLTWENHNIENRGLYEKYITEFTPLLDHIKKFYIVNDYCSLITRLKPNGIIKRHIDRGSFLETIHRLHIPIQTNPKCVYHVDSLDINMKVGSLYEIDNQRQHGVTNNGDNDRIQLIVNVYGTRRGDVVGAVS